VRDGRACLASGGMDLRRLRPLALACGIVVALGLIYSVVVAVVGWDPPATAAFRALLHLAVGGLLAGTALGGAAGRGTVPRVAFGVAVLGTVLLALAELVDLWSTTASEPLYTAAPLLVGLGAVVGGVAVLRHRAWTGWHRVVPLVGGVWVFVVLVPALAASGGPPASAAVWAIASWELVWLLLAVALVAETGARAPAPRTRAVA
jgi:hypothetical protein